MDADSETEKPDFRCLCGPLRGQARSYNGLRPPPISV
ncbi:hypothetical protein YSA_05493 [Pseudomonas putida ND6]|uniref:Uncharacterized protein n=1 Tax=Pseudomonas putida ND6 TaxID=231023 RepID=I3UW67_PSEPU|nr:hypothetical protein YSA_05493 [Pseudomonas putida ND6]